MEEQGPQDLDGEREELEVDQEAGTDGQVSLQCQDGNIARGGLGSEEPVSFVLRWDIVLRIVSKGRSDISEFVVNENECFIGNSLEETTVTVGSE